MCESSFSYLSTDNEITSNFWCVRAGGKLRIPSTRLPDIPISPPCFCDSCHACMCVSCVLLCPNFTDLRAAKCFFFFFDTNSLILIGFWCALRWYFLRFRGWENSKRNVLFVCTHMRTSPHFLCVPQDLESILIIIYHSIDTVLTFSLSCVCADGKISRFSTLAFAT